MKNVLILLAFVLVVLSVHLYCKRSPEPEPCWDSCPFPRQCFGGYRCECRGSGMFFHANMCLSGSRIQYVALLPERDFLDTFALMITEGFYGFSPQSNPYSSTSSVLSYYKFPTYDSVYITGLPTPGTGPMSQGWPTLNGKKFFFNFEGIIKHENRDTMYAKLRWFGLGTADDLQAPVQVKMYIPRGE